MCKLTVAVCTCKLKSILIHVQSYAGNNVMYRHVLRTPPRGPQIVVGADLRFEREFLAAAVWKEFDHEDSPGVQRDHL